QAGVSTRNTSGGGGGGGGGRGVQFSGNDADGPGSSVPGHGSREERPGHNNAKRRKPRGGRKVQGAIHVAREATKTDWGKKSATAPGQERGGLGAVIAVCVDLPNKADGEGLGLGCQSGEDTHYNQQQMQDLFIFEAMRSGGGGVA
ncbi:unnamed protein product, partial [Discosporangium mesarthrocarpum]